MKNIVSTLISAAAVASIIAVPAYTQAQAKEAHAANINTVIAEFNNE